jgi:hypothetical protein
MKIKIRLSEADCRAAQEFAIKRCDEEQSLYQRRGAFKEEDIIIGAMAELGVYRFLRSQGIKVTKPDFKIYAAYKKSYAPDMKAGMRFFHVKGQSLFSANRYGKSWLMQRTDPLVKDPKTGHYICPCVVDLKRGTVSIYGVIPAKSLVSQGCIGECMVPSFRHSKVAIYYDIIRSNLKGSYKWLGIPEDKRKELCFVKDKK